MRVASISKIATALVIVRLVDAGHLSLDASAADLLGPWARNPAFPEAPIRVRDILAHTSSLRDGEVYWAGLGERIADFLTPGGMHWEDGAHWSASHAPGAYFTYCNFGYGVLATIAERVSGMRFDELARALVFQPLGLACGFNWSGTARASAAAGAPVWQRVGSQWVAQADARLPPDRAPVFLNERGLDIGAYEIGSNGLLFAPQGGLRASALDLARLGLFLIGDGRPLMGARLLGAMRAPTWMFDGSNGDTERDFWRGYGLGLQVIPSDGAGPIEFQQRPLIGHSGDAYGLRGGLFMDIEARAGFVFLLNGGPQDAERRRGARSGFSLAEERVMQTLYDLAMAR